MVSARPIAPGELAGAQALLDARLGGTPYVARATDVLRLAASGDDGEHRAVVIDRDGTLAGLALFGAIGGTESGHRILTLVAGGDDLHLASHLIDAVIHAVVAMNASYLVAELAEDAPLAWTIEMLRRCGFEEEGRIPDYFRDGVPLVILRRDFP